MANEDLRSKVGEYNLKLWQVAHKLGITDASFSRLLRLELSPEKKKEILDVVEKLHKERG